MAHEYSSAGEDRYQDALDDFPAYIRSLLDGAHGIGLPSGRVPYSTYWLVSGRRLIGRSSIRHRLTPDLAYEGGMLAMTSARRKGGKGMAR
jgi:predicted acetyltransferase